MFERLTHDARRAVVLAREEARDLRARHVEPVHLLLALTRDPGRGGTALRALGLDHAAALGGTGPLDAGALAAVGIDLDRVRAAAESAFGPGALDRGPRGRTGRIPFDDRARQALRNARWDALAGPGPRRRRLVDTGRLVIGVLAVADPTVQRVLRAADVDLARLWEELDRAPAA